MSVHQVNWFQKGPLDLALYIPYSMKITPLERPAGGAQ